MRRALPISLGALAVIGIVALCRGARSNRATFEAEIARIERLLRLDDSTSVSQGPIQHDRFSATTWWDVRSATSWEEYLRSADERLRPHFDLALQNDDEATFSRATEGDVLTLRIEALEPGVVRVTLKAGAW